MFNADLTPDYFNAKSQGHFPSLLGIEISEVKEGHIVARMPVRTEFFAPNGFLHAGSIVTFADTIAGYSTVAHLPPTAKSFTTLELKSNFMRAIREGFLGCESTAEHMGRTTQVWRVVMHDEQTRKQIAVFSCTQLVLY